MLVFPEPARIYSKGIIGYISNNFHIPVVPEPINTCGSETECECVDTLNVRQLFHWVIRTFFS